MWSMSLALRTRSYITVSALGLSGCVTLFLIGALLLYANYGLDFTDEGFYLTWMRSPFDYSVSVTQFGYVYHSLFRILQGNIAALRQANILLTVALACWVADILLKTICSNETLSSTVRLVFSASIGVSVSTSFVFAGMWLPTPSYNSLALQALLLYAAGFMLAQKSWSRTSFLGWFLIALGGALAFMAKPTSAVLLCLVATLSLLLTGKIRVQLLAICLLTSATVVLLLAAYIDGSVFGFISRLKNGIEMASLLGSGHSFSKMFRLGSFWLSSGVLLIATGCTLAMLLAMLSATSEKYVWQRFGVFLSISLLFAGIGVLCRFLVPIGTGQGFHGLLLLSAPLGGGLASISAPRLGIARSALAERWPLIAMFVGLPYVYAFGTNNNYWIAMACASIFFVLAGLASIERIASGERIVPMLLSYCVSVQLLTAVVVQSGLESPYRQPQPLRENNFRVGIGESENELILSKSFGEFILEVLRVTHELQFKVGTPMIDLSGRSPGILYVLGARNIGQPWLIGGYPGSDDYAAAALRKLPCEDLVRAWVLDEPEGTVRISPAVLHVFGAHMDVDFELAGSFWTAPGVGGDKRSRLLQVWRPTRSEGAAVLACAASRVPTQ